MKLLAVCAFWFGLPALYGLYRLSQIDRLGWRGFWDGFRRREREWGVGGGYSDMYTHGGMAHSAAVVWGVVLGLCVLGSLFVSSLIWAVQ